MRCNYGKYLVLLAMLSLAASLPAEDTTLFENVRIFDGESEQLSEPRNVLVRGNKVERISATPIPIDRGANSRVIKGDGHTLMPGLIDMHWHTMLVRPSPTEAIAADVGYLNIVATAEARDTLLRGFTTIRDLGGPAFGLDLPPVMEPAFKLE